MGRRRYERRNLGWGTSVSDSAYVASRFGPKGAIGAGVGGFILFYYGIPWALTAWANHNKAKLVGQHSAILSKLLDDIFLRRFIHPSEWAGIAILLVCSALAVWKLFCGGQISGTERDSLTGRAKLLARLLD